MSPKSENTETQKELDFDDATGTSLVPAEPVETHVTITAPPMSFNDLGVEDMAIPRLKLVQGISQSAQQGMAKTGEYFLDGFPAIKNPTIVPLGAYKLYQRDAINDKGARIGVACWRHQGGPDEECPNCRVRFDAALQTQTWTAQLRAYLEFLIYIVDFDIPAVIDFASSAYNVGKNLSVLCYGRPVGSVAFKMGSKSVTANGKTWVVPNFVMTQVDPSVREKAQVFAGIGGSK